MKSLMPELCYSMVLHHEDTIRRKELERWHKAVESVRK